MRQVNLAMSSPPVVIVISLRRRSRLLPANCQSQRQNDKHCMHGDVAIKYIGIIIWAYFKVGIEPQRAAQIRGAQTLEVWSPNACKIC